MTPQVRQALEKARQQLDALYGERLRHVVLYGSQARGEAGPESDVDVLVVLEGPVDVYRETRRLVDLALSLFDQSGVYFSFKPYDEETYGDTQRSFIRNVHTDGVEL